MSGVSSDPKAPARVLAVCGDPGGARAVAPVAQELRDRGAKVRLIASETAARLLRADGAAVAPEPTPDEIAVEAAAETVAGFEPDVVLTGAGAFGRIEHAFRLAARARGVATVSVLDYWDNYRARFVRRAEGRDQDSTPDIVCALDEEARTGLVAAGVDPSRIRVTGSPALEEAVRKIAALRARRERLRAEHGIDPDERALVFFSEPFFVAPDGRRTDAPWVFDEKGASRLGYTPLTVLKGVLDVLASEARRAGARCRLLAKPHPREHVPFLREAVTAHTGAGLRVALADAADARELIALSDGVLGMTSVALLEAGLAGTPVVSVQPGLREADGRDGCRAVALGLAVPAYDWQAFRTAARDFLSGTSPPALAAGTPRPPRRGPVVDGAARNVAAAAMEAAARRRAQTSTEPAGAPPAAGPVLRGAFVYLRPPRYEDAAVGPWHSWFNDPEATRYTRHGHAFNSRADQIRFFRNLQGDDSRVVFAVCDARTGEHIGVVSLQSIDRANRKAEIAIMIGSAAHRKSFYGLEAWALITEYGFEELELNKIYAGSHEGLASWVRLMECLGFHEEGRFPEEFWEDGKPAALIRYSCFARDFADLKRRRGGRLEALRWAKAARREARRRDAQGETG